MPESRHSSDPSNADTGAQQDTATDQTDGLRSTRSKSETDRATGGRFAALTGPFKRNNSPGRHHVSRRRSAWRPLVPVAMFGAGLLFATSAETANGTDLRSGRRLQIEQLIGARNNDVNAKEASAASLRRQIDQLTAAQAQRDAGVRRARVRGAKLDAAAGLTPVKGPALMVSLNDAPNVSSQLPGDATVNDVVVHQQDIQAVVNALWAGGAEAVTVMGQRLISTGAVRCVGNVLLLYGRTYSPPFVVAAIGPEASMRAALDASPRVKLYRDAVKEYGLGYSVTSRREIRMPAYTGQVSLPLTGGTG